MPRLTPIAHAVCADSRGGSKGLASALGLSQAKRMRLVDRVALAADHHLYGLVLSGMRRRAPR
jgi:hypothetical protein